jgi:hypothetical protein
MTKLQFRILYREFLFRVIDLELLSEHAQGDASRLLGQFAGVLLIASMWILMGIASAAGGDPRLPESARLVSGWPAQHILIATTMLIVGLFAVVSWESTFPSRRDVLVLAPLPVRARTLFTAKVAASATALGIAVLIPNALPSLSWTLAASPPHRGLLDLLFSLGLYRSFAAYWLTMAAAGGFVFGCVLCVQGLAQFLPRRQFLRASGLLQLGAFCLFVCIYFLQPSLATPAALTAHRNQHILAWLPSYWFLGLFQQFNGSMHPAAAPLALRAWIALAGVGLGSAATYTLSYVGTLRKIVEQPDILPASRHGAWLPSFGNTFETAITQFSLRSLFRSRQHRLILAFYLGMAFAITTLFLRAPVAQRQIMAKLPGSWRPVSAPLLTSSFIVLIAWVVGTRAVSSIPVDLRANWIFRIAPMGGAPACLVARRRTLLIMAATPAWVIWSAIFLVVWPWRPAIGHIVILGLFGAGLTEFCLAGAQKLPFTCSYLPGRSNFHITFWLSVMLIVALIDFWAAFERQALENLARYVMVVVAMLLAAAAARYYATAGARSEGAEVRFEEETTPAVMALGLGRDGAFTIDR